MGKLGVSTVIGVILMVVITIAIACTVYVYVDNLLGEDPFNVDNLLGEDPFNEDIIYGMVIDKFRSPGYGNFLVIQNTTTNIITDIDVTLEVYYLYDIGNYYDSNNIRSWG